MTRKKHDPESVDDILKWMPNEHRKERDNPDVFKDSRYLKI